MGFSKRSLTGSGYIILNTIRVMNIIALLAVVAASLVMLVKTFVVSQFFFFDGVSHVITASLSSMYSIPFILIRSKYYTNIPNQSSSSFLSSRSSKPTSPAIGRYSAHPLVL